MLVLIGNEDKKIISPTCWEDVTTRTFQRIKKEWEPKLPIEDRNPILLFSILTDTNYKITLQERDDQLESAIYQCIAFVYKQDMDFTLEPPPPGIQLRGKFVPLPSNLGSLSIEQNMHLRKALENAYDIQECISLALAVYLQPSVDEKEFDFDLAKKLEEEILLLPIWQTYAAGFFFLSKLKSSGSYGLHDFNQKIQILIERVKKFLNWLRLKPSRPFMT